MMTVKMSVDDAGLSAEALKAKYGLGKGGRAQIALDKAVIDYCKPYCPMDTGVLANSAYTATVLGSGEVVYPGPYAHYQYYGEVYGPNIPIFDDNTGQPTGYYSPPGKKKHPTGRNLTYNTDINPLAGSFWFNRMKADHFDDVVQEVQKAMNGEA